VWEDANRASAAQLLSTLLANERLWTEPADPEQRERLVGDALRIYASTSSVFAEADCDADDHFSQAIWVLRDIADRCAVLSKEWTKKELSQWVDLPDRAGVEDSIRGTGLDAWARDLGFPLALRTAAAEPPAKGKVGRLWKLRTTRRRIADEFVAIEATYRKIQDIRRAEGPEWFKEHTSAMKTSAAYIAGSRNNPVWALTMEDNGAFIVAEALQLVSQGVFVATHAPREVVGIFPTTDYLSAFLHRKGGYRWLIEQRKDVPEWLTSR
jgi:hypothetical protein